MQSYVSRIIEKALAPTIRAIDVLGFTVPPIVGAYYWFLGQKMPEEVGQAIGLWILGGGLSFVILRLLSAPYFVWREDQARIAELEMQLSAPERLELEHISIARANHRLALAGEFRMLHDQICVMPPDNAVAGFPSAQLTKMQTPLAMAGAGRGVLRCYGTMARIAIKMAQSWNVECLDDSRAVTHLAVSCLNGRMTDEELWEQMLPFGVKYPDLSDQLLQQAGIGVGTPP